MAGIMDNEVFEAGFSKKDQKEMGWEVAKNQSTQDLIKGKWWYKYSGKNISREENDQ